MSWNAAIPKVINSKLPRNRSVILSRGVDGNTVLIIEREGIVVYMQVLLIQLGNKDLVIVIGVVICGIDSPDG